MVVTKKIPAKNKAVKSAPVNNTPAKNATSLVMGILSLMFWWIPVVGLVLPIVGLATRKLDETGMGTAGLVTSTIGLVFSCFVHIAWIFALIGAVTTSATVVLM